MSIKDWQEKIKSHVNTVLNHVNPRENSEKYYISIIVILVGLSSFGLGRLSVASTEKQSVFIEKNGKLVTPTKKTFTSQTSQTSNSQKASVIDNLKVGTTVSTLPDPGGKLVASKNGTKYYFPWCGSVSNIAEKNKIWFANEVEARARGFTPASNCKGLK